MESGGKEVKMQLRPNLQTHPQVSILFISEASKLTLGQEKLHHAIKCEIKLID